MSADFSNFLGRLTRQQQAMWMFLLSGAVTIFSARLAIGLRQLLMTGSIGSRIDSSSNKSTNAKNGSQRTVVVAGPNESAASVAVRRRWLTVSEEDRNVYLEDVLGERAIDWVKERNTHALNVLGKPEDNPMYAKILSILDSDDKIPYITKINDDYYNFWQDKKHIRGILRRTTLQAYREGTPAAPTEWETVLDLDALGAAEGESWVYKGYSVFEPDYTAAAGSTYKQRIRRVMMKLSRGGADAVVMREFDLDDKVFVPEEGAAGVPAGSGAFIVPESKSRVAWLSKDVLLVGTDVKDGASMTDSGYPRVMREWRRGTALSDSRVVYEGEQSDVSVYMYVSRHRQHRFPLRGRAITFYTSTNDVFIPHSILPASNTASTTTAGADTSRDSEFAKGAWHHLEVPLDAEVSMFADQLLIQLRSAWTLAATGVEYSQGTLLSVPVVDFVVSNSAATFTLLFAPSSTVSLETYTATKDFLILETLDVVKSRYRFWKFEEQKTSTSTGRWQYFGEEERAMIRGAALSAVDSDESNSYWLVTSSFLQPTSLQLGNAALGPAGVAQVEVLKSLPAQFPAQHLQEQQFLATSADGTQVPYFVISPRDMPLDGNTPTLLYGYGGFEISLTPSYASVVGATWLNNCEDSDNLSVDDRACFVMANIRGGGEFGPAWHQAALREHRDRAYDDFIAVAEDLIRRKITSPAKLGIRGGSNGGLLMGNMMVRRPDLFAAICCAVPLLDMGRYNRLLAGASWVAEYGNPDLEEDWAFLQRYSAYHNIDANAVAANNYPALLMTTSTRDDRVHPYHARSFVKRLQDCYSSSSSSSTLKGDEGSFGSKLVYYENMEGGHGGAADNKQQAFMSVLYLQFLRNVLRK